MYADVPMWLSLVMMIGGLAVLAWSSDLFVDGAAAVAKFLGISPFIIGMVVIGFGTSAPELCVSAMSGMNGHSDLSLGNAYGSCIFNVAVIVGVAVLIFPLVVKPTVTYFAGPLLGGIAAFSLFILRDGVCSRTEAVILLAAFAIVLPFYCWYDQKNSPAKPENEARGEGEVEGGKAKRVAVALVKLAAGLGLLVGSSHYLVWGAVDFAKWAGVSDLVIGLTIVAAGTSLPELASAVQSARKGEHEFVLGNIIGSNLFNTLAVVGLATVISPAKNFSRYILVRDLPLMIALSFSITLFGINWRHPKWPGVIQKKEALVWIATFVGYTLLMLWQETGG